ncbi:MAG: hypothetical protein AAGB19_03290 [Cyanobacteria bacterium P01_F01_bin.3]
MPALQQSAPHGGTQYQVSLSPYHQQGREARRPKHIVERLVTEVIVGAEAATHPCRGVIAPAVGHKLRLSAHNPASQLNAHYQGPGDGAAQGAGAQGEQQALLQCAMPGQRWPQP